MALIETRQLTKNFGDAEIQVQVLRGVDLSINAGEFVAIMGPSGSGKSTLLSILGGIESPSTGDVLLEGVSLASLNDDQRTLLRRRRIGFIFQSFNLMQTLTAVENVALPLELDGVSRSEAFARAKISLERVEMLPRADHIPAKLSGGEQQRVAIARALVTNPAIILADEPTGNLDSRQGERVTELLRQLVREQGQTIVMVTHDSHVAHSASRLICFRDGMIESDQSRSDFDETHPGASSLQAPTLGRQDR
jgi:putative ABC transport system ATP-binding protein